jgi:putative transposase
MDSVSFVPAPGARYGLNGDIYEVTRVEDGFARLRGVEVKRERVLPVAQIATMLRTGVLTRKSLAPIEISSAPMALNMPDTQRKRFLRRLAYVQALHREFGGALPSKEISRVIDEVACRVKDTSPPCIATLYLWMKKYKKTGANPLSQLENGGKPKTSARRISAEVLAIMSRYIREEYLKATRPPAKTVYELFVAELEANNLHRGPDHQLSVPSHMTFSRAISTLDPYVVDLTRLGKETARRRQRYGKAILAPCRIGQRVEVDSHLMDVIVVDEDGNPIGRPWLCAMICVYSRCIVGWEISFTPPCAAKVLRALRGAMSDATPRIFSGSPEELILDNGPEFQNAVLQAVAGTYGVTLRYVEPRSPNEKPHIERFFGTVNTQLVHMMPGTTRSNPNDRGEYESVKNATLRLEEVRDRFGFWLDNVYHKSPHSELHLPPSEMWRIGVEVFAPTRYPDVDLNITCRSFVARTIHGGRVGFANLSWTGPSLPEVAARLAAKGAGTKTQVYYDETDLSFVWVQDPDDRSLLYKAEAVVPAYQTGLSLYEHELLQQVLRRQEKSFSTPELREAKATLYRQLSEDSARARKQLARMMEKSSPAESSGIAERRPDSSSTAAVGPRPSKTSGALARNPQPHVLLDASTVVDSETSELDGFLLE